MTTLLNRTDVPLTYSPFLPKITIVEPIKEKGYNFLHLPINEPVTRIDLCFNQGLLQQSKPFLLKAFTSLILSGTKKLSEDKILDQLDALGAFYNIESDMNYTTFTLFSTPKLISKALPLFLTALFEVDFPENKLMPFIIKQKAVRSQNINKTSYLAKQALNQGFYDNSVLTEEITDQHIESVLRSDLLAFKASFFSSFCNIYLSGSAVELTSLHSLFADSFKDIVTCKTGLITLRHKARPQLYKHIVFASAVQTAYRAIMPCANKSSSDYPCLIFANTLFGGYFGSLLMSNIREEKGLTYGIGSHIASTCDYGFLQIQADIKSHQKALVMEEIEREFNNLINGYFSEEMFEKTRQYLLGQMATSCDELFSNLEKSKMIAEQGLTKYYHQMLFDGIKTASKQQVVNAAKAGINFNLISQTTCGPEQY